MAFTSADGYDRFMGRYSTLLAPQLADEAGIAAGMRVLDVGCGPGALTAELVRRVGADHVTAVDPSEPFVAAAGARFPDVDVRRASAESLPFEVGSFDAALAQLVVHFMSDPVAGLAEMRRVTKPGGVVAASVWDHEGRGPLSVFWTAARSLDPTLPGEGRMPGVRPGHLPELMRAAGLHDVRSSEAIASLEHPSFEAWWEPFTLGVGPAGAYVAGMSDEGRTALRERCRSLLPPAPFSIDARAWVALGTA